MCGFFEVRGHTFKDQNPSNTYTPTLTPLKLCNLFYYIYVFIIVTEFVMEGVGVRLMQTKSQKSEKVRGVVLLLRFYGHVPVIEKKA